MKNIKRYIIALFITLLFGMFIIACVYYPGHMFIVITILTFGIVFFIINLILEH